MKGDGSISQFAKTEPVEYDFHPGDNSLMADGGVKPQSGAYCKAFCSVFIKEKPYVHVGIGEAGERIAARAFCGSRGSATARAKSLLEPMGIYPTVTRERFLFLRSPH